METLSRFQSFTLPIVLLILALTVFESKSNSPGQEFDELPLLIA